MTAAKIGVKTVVLPGSCRQAVEKEETGTGGALPEFIYADNLKEAIDILFS